MFYLLHTYTAEKIMCWIIEDMIQKNTPQKCTSESCTIRSLWSTSLTCYREYSMFVSACDVLVSFCLDFGVLVFSVYFRCFGFSRVRVCLFLVPRILPTNLFPSIGLRNNNSLQYYSIGRARTHTHAPALGLSRIHDMICYSISRAPACYGLPVILCITHTHEGQAAEQRI